MINYAKRYFRFSEFNGSKSVVIPSKPVKIFFIHRHKEIFPQFSTFFNDIEWIDYFNS